MKGRETNMEGGERPTPLSHSDMAPLSGPDAKKPSERDPQPRKGVPRGRAGTGGGAQDRGRGRVVWWCGGVIREYLPAVIRQD